MMTVVMHNYLVVSDSDDDGDGDVTKNNPYTNANTKYTKKTTKNIIINIILMRTLLIVF